MSDAPSRKRERGVMPLLLLGRGCLVGLAMVMASFRGFA